MDEPTRGIDVGTKQQIYTSSRRSPPRARAIIVISSEMQEMIGLSHRVVVMRDGRIAGVLEGDEITEDRNHAVRRWASKQGRQHEANPRLPQPARPGLRIDSQDRGAAAGAARCWSSLGAFAQPEFPQLRQRHQRPGALGLHRHHRGRRDLRHHRRAASTSRSARWRRSSPAS